MRLPTQAAAPRTGASPFHTAWPAGFGRPLQAGLSITRQSRVRREREAGDARSRTTRSGRPAAGRTACVATIANDEFRAAEKADHRRHDAPRRSTALHAPVRQCPQRPEHRRGLTGPPSRWWARRCVPGSNAPVQCEIRGVRGALTRPTGRPDFRRSAKSDACRWTSAGGGVRSARRGRGTSEGAIDVRRRPGVTRAILARLTLLTAVVVLVAAGGCGGAAAAAVGPGSRGRAARAVAAGSDVACGEGRSRHGRGQPELRLLQQPEHAAGDSGDAGGGRSGRRAGVPERPWRQVDAAALGAGAGVDLQRAARVRLRRGARRRGAPVGLQHDAGADDRPPARPVQPARLRDVLGGPAADRQARRGGHERDSERAGHGRDAQALQPQHAGAPSQHASTRRSTSARCRSSTPRPGRRSSTRRIPPRRCARSRRSTGSRRARTAGC